VLTKLSETHEPALLTALEVQAGVDEFGGVLRPGRIGDVLLSLWENFREVPIRYSLASGEIDVLLEGDGNRSLPSLSGADGSALHRATAQLEELRESRSLFGIRLGEKPSPTGALLSSLGEMSYLHLLSWTARQAEVFFAYRRLGVQTEVARELGIDQSTVSHTLSKLEYRPMLDALATLAKQLDAATGEEGA
jgi:DNA-binding transcriptional ArsR family regulator